MLAFEPPPAGTATVVSCCEICDAPGIAWHRIKGHELLRCRACEHGWLARRPADEDLDPLYDEAYFTGAEDGYPDYLGAEESLRRTARGHLDVLDRLHPQRGLLLDIGCAAGFLLDEARRRGWRTVGIERSRAMASFATEQLGLTVHRGRCCERMGRDGEADAVTVVQVLEHVTSPVRCCLEGIAAQLRPGGTLLVETWDSASWTARLMGRRWQQLSPPSVQHWFSERSLRRALERAGLEVLAIDRPGKSVDVDRVLSLVESKYLPRTAAVLRRATRRLGLKDRPIPYPLDDLIRVVARRI